MSVRTFLSAAVSYARLYTFLGTRRKVALLSRSIQKLRSLGWHLVWADENYLFIQFSRGAERLDVIPSLLERLTPLCLRDVEEIILEYVPNRTHKKVALYVGIPDEGILGEAAARGITCISLSELGHLDDYLSRDATAQAKRRHFEQEILTRPDRLPVPTPLSIEEGPEESTYVIRTSAVACFVADRGGDDLLITFANQWLDSRAHTFTGDTLSREGGRSVIGFVAQEPNWYPADDMAGLIFELNQRLCGRFPNRVTLGHSQGGYAAIKFARLLDARLTIALSPQYSIDRRSIVDDRFNKYFVSDRNLGMAIASEDFSKNVIILFDPYEAIDVSHVALISKLSYSTEIAIPFFGHGTDAILANAAFFSEFLRLSLEGDIAALRRFLGSRRAARRDRPYIMALRLAEKRPQTALSILNNYASGWSTECICHVTYKLAVVGRAEEVLHFMDELASKEPDNPLAQGTAGIIAMLTGKRELAFSWVSRAIDLEPGNLKWRHVLKELQFEV